MTNRHGDEKASLDRRSFLTTAAAAAAAFASSCGRDGDGPADEVSLPARDPGDWGRVREQFDLSPGLVHLGALYISSHPRQVREAIDKHRRGLNADPVNYLNDQIGENERRVLNSASEYFGVPASHVALTDSTTMGLGLIYNGLDVSAGQEVLTTEQNYYSTDEALRLKAASTDVSVRRSRCIRIPQRFPRPRSWRMSSARSAPRHVRSP